jgi:hypothetical protein
VAGIVIPGRDILTTAAIIDAIIGKTMIDSKAFYPQRL